jgi:arylsulfatase A-like enzyme
LLLLLIPFLLSLSAGAAEDDARKPNIVVIVADDISHHYLGSYGGRTPTPQLDKLAEQGIRFDAAYAVTPICNPSRYTLLAGQYPGRNAKVDQKTPEGEQYHLMQSTDWVKEDPSIARILNDAGYFTGYIGKWHSNFEIVVETLGEMRKLNPDKPEDSARMKEIQETWQSAIADESGFDRVLNVQMGNAQTWTGTQRVHNPEYITLGALEFLDEAAEKGEPFFLHLANTVPHAPDNIESLKADARYTSSGKWEKTTTELSGHPARETVFERMEEAGIGLEGSVPSINAGTIVLDDQLELVRAKLQEMGVAESTVIIWLGDHNIYGKGSPYVPGVQVPLIVSWPQGLPENKVIETPVSLVDLFRTCAELANAELPEDKVVDGKSLLPLIQGETDKHPPLYIEYGWHRGIIDGPFHYVAFRPDSAGIERMKKGEIEYAVDDPTERRKYANNFGEMNMPYKPGSLDPDQLYDLRIDPFERVNVAYHPAYADKVAEMKAKLAEITETIDHPFPVFDVPPFMETMEYRELVVNRRERSLAKDRDFKNYDGERVYNLNLPPPPEQ